MTQAERLARVEAQLEGMNEKLDRLIGAVDGAMGMCVRLDRLEQAHKRIHRLSFVVASTALAALTTSALPRILALIH